MTDKLVAELRACAFCKATVPQVYASLHHVHCNVCGAVAPKQSWNTRAADALEPSGDVVERVARAILNHRSVLQADTQWAIESEENREWYRGLAKAAIAALGASHAE